MIIWPYSKANSFYKFYNFFMILPPFFAVLQHNITVQDYQRQTIKDKMELDAVLPYEKIQIWQDSANFTANQVRDMHWQVLEKENCHKGTAVP